MANLFFVRNPHHSKPPFFIKNPKKNVEKMWKKFQGNWKKNQKIVKSNKKTPEKIGKKDKIEKRKKNGPQ